MRQLCLSVSIQASKKVAIVTKRYLKNRHNTVVFNWRCKSCYYINSLTLDKGLYFN